MFVAIVFCLQKVMEVGRDNFDILYDVTIKYEMWEDEETEGVGLPPGVVCEWVEVTGNPVLAYANVRTCRHPPTHTIPCGLTVLYAALRKCLYDNFVKVASHDLVVYF